MKDDKSVSISKRMEELEEKMNWFKGDEFTLDEAAERYAEVEKMAGEIEEILIEMQNSVELIQKRFD